MSGVYATKVGQEQAFREAWTAFADWTVHQQPGAGEAWLLQDTQQPQRFISFAPWESTDAVNAWRSRPEFGAFAARVQELCAEFQGNSLRLAAHVTAGAA